GRRGGGGRLGWGRGGARRLLEAAEGGDQGRVVAVAVGAGRLDAGHHRPDRVAERQQAVDDVGADGQAAVAGVAQEGLALGRDGAQPGQAGETGAALDRVDGPEDRRQRLDGAGVLLQREQVALDLVDPLLALQEEFLDDLVAHPRSPRPAPAREVHRNYT